ncbi:MAG: excisionase family DNA-binding protein [Planctomycetaceae bacterium]|nr:excisionase family DNA-binding protein [Planctomycetaceae bacterium]
MSRGFAEDRPYISTLEAAKALGVSVSTIKRWVDVDILPAHRTAGGHRKLMRSEVLALARQGDLPREDLARLAVPIRKSDIDVKAVADALHRALLEGDVASSRAVVRCSYEAGLPIETLADEVIAPVMAKVGHGWETSQIDVWHEHRGTQVCTAALFELQTELERRAESERPLAIGAAPAGDLYILPSLLAQLVLLDAGWEAINLGGNTPLESLSKALRALRPRLVWLTISHLEDVEGFVSAYRDFHREADRQGAAVVVGGRALIEAVRARLPYSSFGDRLTHLGTFARTLHPRPKRPNRGRPRKV